MDKDNSRDSYTHILKYTGLFGGIQLLVILVGIVRNKLVAVILGPSGMGLASLFQSTITLFSNSTNFGIPMSAVKNISEAYERDDKECVEREIALVRSWSFIAALIGTVLCAFLAPVLDVVTFSWGNHSLHFVLLSPIVGLMAITGGELAVLKGTRKLRDLASISVYNVVGTLVITVPIYYIWGESGIVPVLVLTAFVQLLFTILFSAKYNPWKLTFNRGLLSKGWMMIKLGLAFVFAGIMGSAAEFIIRSYLNNVASLSVVGLYSAGYTIVVVYGGMVFSAMETDFFPRLSAVNSDVISMNNCINKQMEVSVLLLSPLIACFIIFMPFLVPLLYSGKFIPILGMVQISALSMYMRALYLPIEYVSLAKSDSRSFLLLEIISSVILMVFAIMGFNLLGLVGIGAGIALSSFVEVVIVFVYSYYHFNYRISGDVVKSIFLQIPLGLFAYGVTFINNPVLYWAFGIVVAAASLSISLYVLRSKTNLWNALKRKIEKKD